jgi:hypothetical protein
VLAVETSGRSGPMLDSEDRHLPRHRTVRDATLADHQAAPEGDHRPPPGGGGAAAGPSGPAAAGELKLEAITAPRSRAARPGTVRRRYYVYVVELDDAVGPRRNPRYPSVYVGQSVLPPQERLRQHKDGYRSSRYVRKHGKHLRPGLYRRFNPMATRDEAVAVEQELARRLRNRGYTVYGGH